MATYLTLCQDAVTEAGISDTAISSVLAQQGLAKKMVGWVARAWVDIQVSADWRFMAAKKPHVLTLASNYSMVTLAFADIRKLDRGARRCLITRGSATKPLNVIEREEWDARFAGILIPAGFPDWVMLDGDVLRYTPAPSVAGDVVSLGYYKTPQILVANTDIPAGIADDLHDAIKWRAVHKYAKHDVSESIKRDAREEYSRLISRMRRVYLPCMTWDAMPLDSKRYADADFSRLK